jgi:hypothetical protein
VAVAAGWGFLIATNPHEPGEPVSLVGDVKAAGRLEFALADPLTSAPEGDGTPPSDDDPAAPEFAGRTAVAVETLAVSFQVKGNRRMPVQITAITPEIIGRDPVQAGTLVVFPPAQGEKPAIELVSNLDAAHLVVRDPTERDTAWFSKHHVELAKDENQQFAITFSGRMHTYSFRIVVEYTAGDGTNGRLVITNRDGLPFRLTGKPLDGRYGAVYLPNHPKDRGWHACGSWPEDLCAR